MKKQGKITKVKVDVASAIQPCKWLHVGVRRFVVASIVSAAVAGCSTNPYTERSQLLLLPEAFDGQLGRQAYQQVVEAPDVVLSSDLEQLRVVNRVAERIIKVAKESKYGERAKTFEWEVVVIDDETRNAFALPGGKIAVYTGIFPIAQNEAGLAAILGHEVTHALARHGTERMSQGVATQAALIGTDLLLGEHLGPVSHDVLMQAFGLSAQIGVILPFSRKHEEEADYIGLLLAAQAGYDPREAVHVWERMSQASDGQPPEFMSTHPSHGKRIENLQAWMPDALRYYEAVARSPSEPLPSIDRPSASREVIADIQSRLSELGYDVGAPDGISGQRTVAAVRAYQEAAGLPVDGKPSVQLLEHLHENRVP